VLYVLSSSREEGVVRGGGGCSLCWY